MGCCGVKWGYNQTQDRETVFKFSMLKSLGPPESLGLAGKANKSRNVYRHISEHLRQQE